MLRKRSRAVISKESMVGEHSHNLCLPPEKTPKPNSFFINSPRFLKSFFTFSSETESIISPTSILDPKPFSALANTFWAAKKIPTPKTFSENKHFWDQPNNSKGIGIASPTSKIVQKSIFLHLQNNKRGNWLFLGRT
uniref:Uncharacterized protein n=1 Tax=Opuntia streptacantha TaxID=393608 RepID=A0A7C9CZU0_OPUST